MMTVLLIRHGARQAGADGPEGPLSAEGLAQVAQLARVIRAAALSPQVFASSAWRHATQTASAVRDAAAPAANVIAVDSLTPDTPTTATLHDMRAQLANTIDLGTLTCFACVGHEPRLGQLTEALTGARLPRLNYAEARRVQAESFAHLLRGEGHVTAISADVTRE